MASTSQLWHSFSASFPTNSPTAISQLYSHPKAKLGYLTLIRKKNRTTSIPIPKRKPKSLKTINSVLNDKKSSINDNGTAQSARVLLERLFKQTQKLEEQMTNEYHLSQDVQLGLNLQGLESDLQAALTALKKKEEDMQNAESMFLLECSNLNNAKEELVYHEREIAAASHKYEKLENELKEANHKLASQAIQIEDLKLRLRDRDQDIAALQSALSLKEEEMNKMKNYLKLKSEEVLNIDLELKSKLQLLNEANKVVRRQEMELQQLQKAIRENEEQLEVSLTKRKNDAEKVKVAEGNLEKQATQWLLGHEELKKLAVASKQAGENNETFKDFRRVKNLLIDVRSELVSSQKSLASSRKKLHEQEQLLEKQLEEIEELKRTIMSYMRSLKEAKIEVESEKVKLRVSEARNRELEQDLLMKKELIKELQEELEKERCSMQQAAHEMSLLQEELERRNTEFSKTNDILHTKEFELVEAKLEIQHLKSEKASLHIILEEKDLELLNAGKKLEEVSHEITDLKMLLSTKEKQLLQATNMLREQDENVQIMQNELFDTKHKASEAKAAIEQILELTSKLVFSNKKEDFTARRPLEDMDKEVLLQPREKSAYDFRLLSEQLETELELTKESLRMKVTELLAAQMALTSKEEEHKMALTRLDAREKDLEKSKEKKNEDAGNLRRWYALAEETTGEKSNGDLATKKLELKAANQVEAAISALSKLAEMSQELLNKASLSIKTDGDTTILLQNTSSPLTNIAKDTDYITEVKNGVSRLSILTELLVKEAGIVCAVGDETSIL